MPNALRGFVVASFIGLIACASSAPPREPATTQPAPAATPDTTPPEAAPAASGCEAAKQDAYAVVNAHNACTTDAECATASQGCAGELACGTPVRADAVERVDAELAPIWERYKAECGDCVRERVRCMRPTAVCREGRCSADTAR